MALVVAVAALLSTSCSIGAGDPSAQYFRTTKLVANPPPAVVENSNQSLATQAVVRGQLPMPNRRLTPGVVGVTDLTTVCRQGKHIKGLFSRKNPAISLADQQLVFSEYGIPLAEQKRYGLDFLVPQLLGGANTPANIWPIKKSGAIGFHEKERLSVRLHIVVCHGELPLADAQQEVAADWGKLYVKYGG
jgi:hypothetical protein